MGTIGLISSSAASSTSPSKPRSASSRPEEHQRSRLHRSPAASSKAAIAACASGDRRPGNDLRIAPAPSEPCHVKAAAIPPDDFVIPPDLARRIELLNRDPARYRKLAWRGRHDPDFLEGFIKKLEERSVRYREWSPRLRVFAKQCRVDRPSPNDELLDIVDREQQRIYEAKFNEPPLTGGETTVALCSMPLIAMSVARRLWPINDEHMVLLTAEEALRWNDNYSHPQGCFEWIANFWWNVDDSPNRNFPLNVPEGESPWIVTIGHQHGPICGAGHDELWSWNGRQARLIEKLGWWIS